MLLCVLAYKSEESIGDKYVADSVLTVIPSTQYTWLVVNLMCGAPTTFANAYLLMDNTVVASKSLNVSAKRLNITFPYTMIARDESVYFLLESVQATILYRIATIENTTIDYEYCFTESNLVRTDASAEFCISTQPTNCHNVFGNAPHIITYFDYENTTVTFDMQDAEYIHFKIAETVDNSLIYSRSMDNFYEQSRYYCVNCNQITAYLESEACRRKLFLSYSKPVSLLFLKIISTEDDSWYLQTSARQSHTRLTCDKIFCKEVQDRKCVSYHNSIEMLKAIKFTDQLYVEYPIITVMGSANKPILFNYWMIQQPYLLGADGYQDIYQSSNYCDYDNITDTFRASTYFTYVNMNFNREILYNPRCKQNNASEYHIFLDALRIDNSSGKTKILNYCHTSMRLDVVEQRKFKLVMMSDKICTDYQNVGLFIFWDLSRKTPLGFLLQQRYEPKFRYRSLYCIDYHANMAQTIYDRMRSGVLMAFFRNRDMERDYWVSNIKASFFYWKYYYLLVAAADTLFAALLTIVLLQVKIH